MVFSTGGSIQYGYTMDGIKRCIMYKEANNPDVPVVATVYCDHVIYEDDTCCFDNLLKYIDVDGKILRLYVETNGFGHVFVTTGSGKSTTVYAYGRYGDLNWNKSSSASLA